MRSVVAMVLMLALAGCTHASAGPTPPPEPSSALQHGLLARLAADPAVVVEMIGREPRGVVLCGIDLLGRSEGERYAWLVCGDFRIGPDAELLSGSAEPVVIRGNGVEFPRQAHLDADYDRLFPAAVVHAIRDRAATPEPTQDELLALAIAAAPVAAPSR